MPTRRTRDIGKRHYVVMGKNDSCKTSNQTGIHIECIINRIKAEPMDLIVFLPKPIQVSLNERQAFFLQVPNAVDFFLDFIFHFPVVQSDASCIIDRDSIRIKAVL